MDTVKTNQPIVESGKGEHPIARLLARARSLRLSGLQIRLIVPYVFLTLALAAVGIFIITRLVVYKETDAFSNRILEASRVTSDSIVRQERTQLESLRLIAFATDMPKALQDKDLETILGIVKGITTNQQLDIVSVLDANGQEIITLGWNKESAEFQTASGGEFASLPFVNYVLNGKADNEGDKYVELIKLSQGWTMFTSAPVIDKSKGQIVGAVLVGTYVDRVLEQLTKQSTADYILLLSQNQQLIATNLLNPNEGFDELLADAVQASKEPDQEKTYQYEVKINRRTYKVAYSPLIVRSKNIGMLGVVMNTDLLVSSILVSRTLFIILFTIGTMAVIIIGYFLATSMARPILKLRDLSQAVAGGDLNQNIGLQRKDEIGELATAFDTMTTNLRERTEEAARLFAETVQRNKELAEINAKLEATQLQLIQSEKLASIGQLTAGIVHDVKNPFAVIMGMAEVLSEDETMDESVRHSLRVMRESAVKGNKIVTDLLKFARQQKPEMRYADIRETVEAAVRLTAYLTRRYNLVKELPDTALLMTFDAQQIEQVLINMIHNSLQAMPEGGMLRLALQKVGGDAHLIVQDTGGGIAPEHRRRIFDPFFTTKPEGQGTGLGLSVSYGIIKNHGGTIECQSELGIGTTFTIIIPIVQPSLNEMGE
jgi:two-component system, NtrC family, sensor kinase